MKGRRARGPDLILAEAGLSLEQELHGRGLLAYYHLVLERGDLAKLRRAAGVIEQMQRKIDELRGLVESVKPGTVVSIDSLDRMLKEIASEVTYAQNHWHGTAITRADGTLRKKAITNQPLHLAFKMAQLRDQPRHPLPAIDQQRIPQIVAALLYCAGIEKAAWPHLLKRVQVAFERFCQEQCGQPKVHVMKAVRTRP
ncbi:MAG: hypothetical protein JWM53_6418 [bacterium]|nr:hypothetical protein [bacterium]